MWQHLQWEGTPGEVAWKEQCPHLQEAGVVQLCLPGVLCHPRRAETSRCSPARSSSESAAGPSVFVLEGNLDVWFFFCEDFLLYVFSAEKNLAVTRELPSIFAPWCRDGVLRTCWCSLPGRTAPAVAQPHGSTVSMGLTEFLLALWDMAAAPD